LLQEGTILAQVRGSFWIISAELAYRIVWPMSFHQIVSREDLLMQQSPHKDSAFGSTLAFQISMILSLLNVPSNWMQ
jgi:hypothetical protein